MAIERGDAAPLSHRELMAGMVKVPEDYGWSSTQLPGNFHKDPADRIIVSLSRRLTLPLLTCANVC